LGQFFIALTLLFLKPIYRMITVSRIVLVVGVVCLTSSCAVHSGMITSSQLGNTKINYRYEDVAVGYAKAKYFLGIGGLKKDALLSDAKRNLYLSYPLKPNQVFQNITLDRKTTYLLPFSKVELILVADVIGLESGHEMRMGDDYLSILANSTVKSKDDLSNYEPVLLLEKGKAYTGRVVSINRRNATIFYVNDDGLIRVGNKTYTDIFKVSNVEALLAKAGVQLGEEWNFSLNRSNSSSYILRGKVLGINNARLLIETQRGAQAIRFEEIGSKS
jgi:hypothetical protein